MLISSPAAHAEVMLDGTLGPGGPLAGPDYAISDDLGQLRGSNLFHSFGKFNINTGESATFTGPTSVANILGRVTGGNASLIDGRLSSQIPGANLYLMNPSGLMFGPNAILDISGSFHATTADYIGLADGGRFDAAEPSNSVLTAAPPEAFGFLGGNPAGISIDKSTLSVPSAETVSLIGGEIEITGDPELNPFEADNVAAPGGRVNIVSVASAGEVVPNASVATPDIAVDGFETLGKTRISEGALVNTSGESGGTVVIRGGRLMLDGAAIFADTQGDIDGAPVGVDINVSDSLSVVDGLITTDALAAGVPGDIHIDVSGNLSVVDGGQIKTQAIGAASGFFGEGLANVGDIDITAASILIAGTGANAPSGILAQAFTNDESGATPGTASGGDINIITTGALELRDGGLISVSSNGLNSGNITVRADTVELAKGAVLDSNNFGLGYGAGDIEVIARTVRLTGPSSEDQSTGIFALSGSLAFTGDIRLLVAEDLKILYGAEISSRAAGGPGSGGRVEINAGSVLIAGRDVANDTPSRIDVRALIFPNFFGELEAGPAGGVRVAAETLEVTDHGEITAASSGAGNGGSIQLDGIQLSLTEGAVITVESTNTGEAGGVSITASESFRSDRSSVSTEAAQADGGSIRVAVGELVYLNESEITATVGGGEGRGGDISIQTELSSFVVLNKTDIMANAFEGPGGNILIVTDKFIASADSAVTASSDFGVDGEVVIRSPQDTVVVGVEALPESFLDVSSLLSERCAARTEGKVGSFVVLGRGGVPPGPDAALSSSDLDIDTQTDARSASTTDNHEAEHSVVRKGQRLLSGDQPMNSIIPARLVFSCGD